MRPLKTSQNVRELTLSIRRRFKTFLIRNDIGLGLGWTQHHGGPLHSTPRGRGCLQEVQEVIRHHLEPVKLSEIYTSCRSESTVVFSSFLTLDWVWGGPNTMRDLPTVSPGVGGSLLEV